MFRFRYSILFVLLLLLPLRADPKSEKPDESENEDSDQNEDSDEEDDDDNEAEETQEKFGHHAAVRSTVVHKALLTRTMKRRPLECYVCTYKHGVELKSCLDPWKNRVHTMTCPNLDDKCYTWIITSGATYDTVMRGCRTGCLGSADTICCEFNRCNNQAFTLPTDTRRVAGTITPPSGDTKRLPPSVVFFVTILLIVQTVARVAGV